MGESVSFIFTAAQVCWSKWVMRELVEQHLREYTHTPCTCKHKTHKKRIMEQNTSILLRRKEHSRVHARYFPCFMGIEPCCWSTMLHKLIYGNPVCPLQYFYSAKHFLLYATVFTLMVHGVCIWQRPVWVCDIWHQAPGKQISHTQEVLRSPRYFLR